MRLTLRTLLAYLDDVLEPAQAQDLGARIGESEFATNLVHRIREAMRREKLGAPRLQGKAAGLDPNTVAEYLDNTLSSERVVDFEKYCLESEVHLAETACCHQVLALVLGEPALVDPDSRRRIYGLLAQYDAKLKSGATPGAASAALAGSRFSGAAGAGAMPLGDGLPQPSAEPTGFGSPPMAMRKRAEVPDYLRQEALGLSAWWKMAAAALVAVLLVCAVMMAVAPLWNKDRLPEGSQTSPSDDGPHQHSDDAAKVDDGQPATIAPAKTESGHEEVKDTPADANKTEDNKVEASKTETNKAEPSKAETVVEPVVDGKTPKVGIGEAPAKVEVDLPPKVPPKGRDGGPPQAADGANVGQLTLAERKGVLFRLDGASGRWSRLPVPASLSAGEVLLCPSACRNTLMLRGDLQAQTFGDTRLELGPSAPGPPPGMRLHYGRLLLITAAEGGTNLPLQAGSRAAKLSFAKPGTTLFLEARLVRSPGTDPEKVRSRTVVDLFVKTGGIVWDEGVGQPITVDAPGRRTLGLVEGEPQPEGVPAWTDPNLQTTAERLAEENDLRALNVLEAKLQNEKAENLRAELPEWIVVQQREVQSLAYRWLISIDQFEEAVRALGQSKNRESYFWPKIIEHLRLAIARDPQTAAKVRQAFETVRGDQATELYRMLWGYSEQDLTQGGHAKRLVGYLDHEDLDFRVLSSWALQDVTGITNSFYRPDAPAEGRTKYVLDWKRNLEAGKIVPPKKKQ